MSLSSRPTFKLQNAPLCYQISVSSDSHPRGASLPTIAIYPTIVLYLATRSHLSCRASSVSLYLPCYFTCVLVSFMNIEGTS